MVVLMRYAIRRSTVRRCDEATVPALALGIGVLLMAAAMVWPLESAVAQETQVIEITAERFSFNPSEIRVKAGTQLEIRLTSEDTMHGFHILGTDIDLELPKRGRGVASVTFQPTTGRYTFECSRLCGAGHAFMRGVIIATE
jgi:cytochrome c oxidase subunit II